MRIAPTPLEKTPVTRRALVRVGMALGAVALVAPLTGCDSFLGIEDPTVKQVDEEPAEVPGTTDFDDLTIALNLDPATWTWSKYDNTASASNGCLVVAIPVTATNNSDISRVLSGLYCKIVSPSGQTQPDISPYYTGDDILQRGSIPVGATETGTIHVLYQGPGVYTFEFDNLLGRKASIEAQISGSQASGLRPIPDSALGQGDVSVAVPAGQPFDVGGLTLNLSADEATYFWTQAWDETNEAWNGRWVIGVPLTITNNSTETQALTADMYGLYAPALYRVEDPAPWFVESSAAYTGPIAPGQTVQTMLYWPWVEDGYSYVVFDNNGAKVVASVRFINE